MESICINDGAVRLMVNDDPTRVIAFNPEDLRFAERVYSLVSHYDKVEAEYRRRAEELDAKGSNPEEEFAILREICEDAKARIDDVFGAGTSVAAFGDSITISMFEQFFEAVTPYVEKARKPKLDKYINAEKRGGVLRK